MFHARDLCKTSVQYHARVLHFAVVSHLNPINRYWSAIVTKKECFTPLIGGNVMSAHFLGLFDRLISLDHSESFVIPFS